MIFNDVIDDIEKLIGLELESIKKGANLTITGIDRATKRVELVTSLGKVKTRPFSELNKIWDELCTSPAAHVDSVLRGSGSSRNQPETIMANLPYIEWFFINGKKHLALIKGATHGYGSLLRMNEIKAVEVKDRMFAMDKNVCEIIVITEDIKSTANTYEQITGLSVKPLSPGVYEQYKDNVRYVFVSKSVLKESLSVGTYVVVRGDIINHSNRNIVIDEKKYVLLSDDGLNFLLITS
ncbi:hypothetical protein [Paenibacillus glacialis]|uniref:Uncharacterized protein n=1 Tax=Paenibacillus glacialis TaxID=494026 RepID=A0A168LJK8_9BACL|nr:hypothetical protein [Paenibacillus glacialis]OAB43479.1 hypothetical protein PGLA_08680 [Paenibacillus glacialis]